jgi:hypothetical protein
VAKLAWEKLVKSANPIRALHIKLCRTAKELKRWNRENVKWTKFVSSIADDVIFSLDVAQEDRNLMVAERERASASVKKQTPWFRRD